MSIEVTPSKQVRHRRVATWTFKSIANMQQLQAASAIESLTMESPVKKLNLAPEDKENQPQVDASIETLAAEMDAQAKDVPVVVDLVKKTEEAPKPAVAPTVKSSVEDEPLLQENPGRFVLFPIKYHEVRFPDALHRRVCPAYRRVKW